MTEDNTDATGPPKTHGITYRCEACKGTGQVKYMDPNTVQDIADLEARDLAARKAKLEHDVEQSKLRQIRHLETKLAVLKGEMVKDILPISKAMKEESASAE